MKIIRRMLAASTLLLAVLCAAPTAAALASTASPQASASPGHAIFAAGASAGLGPATVTPAGKPTGCPPGDMCIYRNGGGSGLCMATPSNEPNMGSCSWIDGAVFNNGYAGNPNGIVSMNRLGSYTGAWTCIATGSYWLYTSHYKFNNGSGMTGYGESVQNSVGSFHWQEHNCGNSGG
jgi:hypothetical protein